MTTWATAKAASGPKVIAWLAEYGVDGSLIHPNQHRTMRRWRSGENAMISAVDDLLVSLGLHISLLPDDVWVESPRYVREDNVELRPCKRCGGDIPYREKNGKAIGPARYAQKHFCTTACHQAYRKEAAVGSTKTESRKQRRERGQKIAARLWEEGLSATAITIVLRLYHDIDITPDVLRKWLPNRTRRTRGGSFRQREAA